MGASPNDDSSCVHSRYAVVIAIAIFAAALCAAGLSFIPSATIAVSTAACAAAIADRLVWPYPTPKTKLAVTLVILVVVVCIPDDGLPPWVTPAAVLAAAFSAVEISRRVTYAPATTRRA